MMCIHVFHFLYGKIQSSDGGAVGGLSLFGRVVAPVEVDDVALLAQRRDTLLTLQARDLAPQN